MEPAVEMYPSLDELIKTQHPHDLPPSLIASLSHRYNEHGMEYASSVKHTDGRMINQCMQKDSILDAREELNDTIFNLLVACLKQSLGQQPSDLYRWKPRAALSLLIQAWDILEGLSGQES